MDSSNIEGKLQGEIEDLVRKNKDVYNAVLGVQSVSGDFRWTGAAGIAHQGRPDAMQVDTPIFIASITKMFTAAAVMILEERGGLSLEDPISRYLPAPMVEGLHVYKGRDYSDQLNIYHLVSQTSGLPDYFEEKPKGGQSVSDLIVSGVDEAWDLERVITRVKNELSPKFPPEPKEARQAGKKAYYADTNYRLLGAILEAASGKELQKLFDELFFEPKELSATYLFGDDRAGRSSLGPPATIYYKERPLQADKALGSFGPDGGMVSNVADSLKFISDFMAGRLFEQPTTFERMKSWRDIFFPFQYGLGLMRSKLSRVFSPFSATPELVGHSGSTSAFLYHSDIGQLYIAGTLNQLENQGRPMRLMLKIIKMVSEAGIK